MKLKTRDNAILTILIVLIISLVLNVYQSVSIQKYKDEIDMASCENIETIRYRNEALLSIFNQAVDTKSLTNEEVLILYKNYTEIVRAELELWEHYLKLKNSTSILRRNTKIEDLEVSRAEILWKLEDFIYSYLKSEMQKGSEKVQLSGDNLDIFITLKNVSNDLNNYFMDFTEKNLKGLEGEERSKEIVKKEYWIDMLLGMVETTNKYVEYEFSYK